MLYIFTKYSDRQTDGQMDTDGRLKNIGLDQFTIHYYYYYEMTAIFMFMFMFYAEYLCKPKNKSKF